MISSLGQKGPIVVPPIVDLETKHEKTPTTLQSPRECRDMGCSLFLGRLDQRLVGNAESTHVDRPKGKATLVPKDGSYCNNSMIIYIG